jgi:hypothetical protein
VNGRANGGQVAELAAPLVRWDAANPGNRLEDEFADRCGRGDAGRSRADQLAEPLLDLLVAIGDEPLLSRKIVIDRLLGDLGIPRHVANRDVLVSVLGEQPGRGIRDQSPRARLLPLPQTGAGHRTSLGLIATTCGLHPIVMAHIISEQDTSRS